MTIQVFPKAGRVHRCRQVIAEQRIDEQVGIDRVRALLYRKDYDGAHREVDRLRQDFRAHTPHMIAGCDDGGDAA